jgi:hypothetical protein
MLRASRFPSTYLEDGKLQDLVPLLLASAKIGIDVAIEEVRVHLQLCQLRKAKPHTDSCPLPAAPLQ